MNLQAARALEDYAVSVDAPASLSDFIDRLYELANGNHRTVGLAVRHLRFKLKVVEAAAEEPELARAYAKFGRKKQTSLAGSLAWSYKQYNPRSDYTALPLKGMSQRLRGQFTLCRAQTLLRAGPMKKTTLAELLGIKYRWLQTLVRRHPDCLSSPSRGVVAIGKHETPRPLLPAPFVAMLLPDSNLLSPPPFLVSMVTHWLADSSDLTTPYIMHIRRFSNPAYVFMQPPRRSHSHAGKVWVNGRWQWDDQEPPEWCWWDFGDPLGQPDWQLVKDNETPF